MSRVQRLFPLVFVFRTNIRLSRVVCVLVNSAAADELGLEAGPLKRGNQ